MVCGLFETPWITVYYLGVGDFRSPCATGFDWVTDWLAVEQSTAWEADSFSCSQKIAFILWNQRLYSCVHSCLFLSTLSARWLQVMPIHTTALSSILILSICIHLGLPSGLFISDMHSKTLHAFVFSHIHAMWPAHLIFPDLMKLTDFLKGTHHEVLCSLQSLPPT